jgi:hypothetical protein
VALSPGTQKLLRWIDITWTMLAVAGMFYCAWLGWNTPSDPDPAIGRTYRIQWMLQRGYVTQIESLLFSAGLINIFAYLVWCAIWPAPDGSRLFQRWRRKKPRNP